MKPKMIYQEAISKAQVLKTIKCKCGRILNTNENLQEMALIIMFGGSCYLCEGTKDTRRIKNS
jgi:hypothetical protein